MYFFSQAIFSSIYALASIVRGRKVMPVCLSFFFFRPLLHFSAKKLKICHNFVMLSERAFIFHFYTPCGKTSSLLHINQGQVSRSQIQIPKMAVVRVYVFHKPILLYLFLTNIDTFSTLPPNHKF